MSDKYLDQEGLGIVWNLAINKFDNIILGYYDNNIFYEDEDKSIIITGSTKKIYIDSPSQTLYSYNGTNFIPVNQSVTWGTF